jgi:HEAT repeat protein
LITRPISIERLVADLESAKSVERETAIARLTVIGARTVERLAALVDAGGRPTARASALRALEAIASPRALDTILRAIDDPDADVAIAAIGAARAFLRGPESAAALDRLTSAALDRERPDAVRAAAVRAVAALKPSTIKPLLARLAEDSSEAVRAAAALRIGRKRRPEPSAMLTEAAERALPDDPSALRLAIVESGASAPLPQLLSIIERIREREQALAAPRRSEWTNARAAAHWTLANRGSRIALYDLKEALERTAAPLPVEFLASLSRIGDASCLEPIVAACSRAKGDTWWRQQLLDLFQTIAKREHVTARHAVMKKIQKRWPGVIESR